MTTERVQDRPIEWHQAATLDSLSNHPTSPLARALKRLHTRKYRKLLSQPEKYKLQILLTHENKQKVVCRHGFRCDAEYFYPASTLKLCVILAALKVMKEVCHFREDVSIWTPLRFHYEVDGQALNLDEDASNKDGRIITIAHLIRRIFLVSDNGSCNLLLDFVGKHRVNHTLREMGYHHFHISGYYLDDQFGPQEEWTFKGIEILTDNDQFCINRARKISESVRKVLFKDFWVGHGFVNKQKQLQHGCMDFVDKHQTSIIELQNILAHLVRPDLILQSSCADLDLSLAQHTFLLESMSQSPTESCNPEYCPKRFPYDWNKFFLPGLCRVRDAKAIKVYNKLGQAYGFSLDNAYIWDIESGNFFFLTANIYTNDNGIMNDDQYEYDKLAQPFLSDLAEAVALEVGMFNK